MSWAASDLLSRPFIFILSPRLARAALRWGRSICCRRKGASLVLNHPDHAMGPVVAIPAAAAVLGRAVFQAVVGLLVAAGRIGPVTPDCNTLQHFVCPGTLHCNIFQHFVSYPRLQYLTTPRERRYPRLQYLTGFREPRHPRLQYLTALREPRYSRLQYLFE